jgi:hypothetical protein
MEGLIHKCERFRKQFAEELRLEKSNTDLMKNNLFLVHQTKALRDVQYQSLEAKLSEI